MLRESADFFLWSVVFSWDFCYYPLTRAIGCHRCALIGHETVKYLLYREIYKIFQNWTLPIKLNKVFIKPMLPLCVGSFLVNPPHLSVLGWFFGNKTTILPRLRLWKTTSQSDLKSSSIISWFRSSILLPDEPFTW